MDLEALVWLVAMIFWFVSSFLGRIAKKKAARARRRGQLPSEGQAAEGDTVFEQILREMAGEEILEPAEPPRPAATRPARTRPSRTTSAAGPRGRRAAQALPTESQRAGETQPTRGEHRATPAEHRQTAEERGWSITEHRKTASEHRRTQREIRPTATEHAFTASEHRAGDLRVADLPPLPAIPQVPRARPRRKDRQRDLLRDLRSSDGLARAVVLREILGPPLGLRSPKG